MEVFGLTDTILNPNKLFRILNKWIRPLNSVRENERAKGDLCMHVFRVLLKSAYLRTLTKVDLRLKVLSDSTGSFEKQYKNAGRIKFYPHY